MGAHDLLPSFTVFRTVYPDKGKRYAAKSQRNQTTTLWRNHVILALRNSALNDLDLAVIEAHGFIATARLHVRSLRVSQQEFFVTRFHNHITDTGLEDVGEILCVQNDNRVHPTQRLEPIAQVFA